MACPVCKGLFTVTRKTQVCCCRKCYLIYWAAERLFEAVRDGRASGLVDEIRELAGVFDGGERLY